MSWRSVRIGLTVIVFGAIAPLAVAQAPNYVQRLQLPVSRDDIGFGQAVTADPHTGEVFVCDPRSNRILIFDDEGYFKFQILGGIEFSSPKDLAVDPEGFLVVLGTQGGRQLPLELDFDGVFRRTLDFDELSQDSVSPILSSLSLSEDGQTVYLADTTNLRLWLLDRQGDVKTYIDLTEGLDDVERRDMFLGQVDVYGDAVLLAIPSHGSIYRFDLEGGLVARIGIKGGGACELGRPTAAALTETGDYFVIDQQRMLLTRWSATGNRCLGEYIGIGLSPGFLYYPYDLALSKRSRLYIAQSFDGRVQVYDGLPKAARISNRSE